MTQATVSKHWRK